MSERQAAREFASGAQDGAEDADPRGAALLKYKRFDDAEFEIVGATGARGTDTGCVVWRCATESGQTFEVVPA
jgi:ATP-dependent DNA ligase